MRAAEQISESTYFKDMDYWDDWAFENGPLEICNENTGEPVYTIGG